jgi:hypothetical protein
MPINALNCSRRLSAVVCPARRSRVSVTELIAIVLSDAIGVVRFFAFWPRWYHVLWPDSHALIVAYDREGRFGFCGFRSCAELLSYWFFHDGILKVQRSDRHWGIPLCLPISCRIDFSTIRS